MRWLRSVCTVFLVGVAGAGCGVPARVCEFARPTTTCDDNPNGSMVIKGQCTKADGGDAFCACVAPATLNPATGRCRAM